MQSRKARGNGYLRSALPDVFLRKNVFEARLLEKEQKRLEETKKKVIERLAKEQEEYAILNCVHFGANGEIDMSMETPKAEVRSLNGEPLEARRKSSFHSSRRISVSTERAVRSEQQGSFLPKELGLRAGNVSREIASTAESRERGLQRRRSSTSHVIKRVDSAPALRAQGTFSGRDGRVMSLTPVMNQLSIGLETSAGQLRYPTQGRAVSSELPVKVLRDLPKQEQAHLKTNVYFLSEHKLKQQQEITKLRQKRAKSAQTFRQNSI